MTLLLALGACIAAIAVVAIIAIRLLLKKKSKELTLRIKSITPFQANQESSERTLRRENDSFFQDIESDLEQAFNGRYITFREGKQFMEYYIESFNEVNDFLKRIETFHVEPSETITKFVSDFENLQWFIKNHNTRYTKEELDVHKDFFDHCLKYPLDKQQRRSIVSEEDNCLVVSSAGSGKTSSIVGKVKYLIEIKGVDPEKILLISYTNKAAAELTDRMGIEGLRGYTFHKLALNIIGQVTGQKPSICSNTDALFLKIYQELLGDDNFKKSVVEYFFDYQIQEQDWERQKNERRQQLSAQKDTRLKAQFPDMDGNTVYVRSEQEQKICLALSLLGVKFRYEEPYEHPLADEMHSQYMPDFSIYYERDGETKRIYLEHFGVDEHSLVPMWFAKDRGITYEEANQQYNDGITWKKAAHEKFGTELLTTSSADFHYYDIKDKLKVQLEKAGVPIKEKTDAELYDIVMPPNSKQEKSFIRLVVTFATLMKSSCKSIQEVIRQAISTGDERNEFIMKNIFQPVYERYIEELKNLSQIDFTDAILQATEMCRTSHPVEYDFIIVDEFQDISVDRYNFLKVLRESNPPAKLYCVGDDWQSIYRFSGSDMALFNQFPDFFGHTDINKIETTYRFGEPLVSLSSQFIQRNGAQIKKDIHPFNSEAKTELYFYGYDRANYCNVIEQLVTSIPLDKSIFLLGRYSFDDYYLSYKYKSTKEGNRFYYFIGNRKIEFLTAHKSKGLEADYVIILQCNKDTYGFPSLVSDDPVLNYVLTKSDQYPYGEERRLFYVSITRAKIKTFVLYDNRFPSVFVDEFLHPEKITQESYAKHPNANKKWTKSADLFLLKLHSEGKSIKYIAAKMGRSQTSIVMRLGKLNANI
ncbi:UvrD-helicase domain-containing protein [Muribaculum intestinale]|uniref:DNA 3'-5' helicase n=1 Tax=Muribaculum intestinale TaxID=1796646 RepID=A0A4S2G288_9BACT|nr:UvrD-helicase domain-containing protein [Muribaculum intestinale]MYM11231.1 UvrD-helicase domain-containing protein [Muribaculum intestinale]TGY76040.1 helicase IV [Muribaculum intestinale]